MIQMKVNTFEEIIAILQKNVINNRNLLKDLATKDGTLGDDEYDILRI